MSSLTTPSKPLSNPHQPPRSQPQADVYMIDEPSSYLDVRQRLKAAQVRPPALGCQRRRLPASAARQRAPFLSCPARGHWVLRLRRHTLTRAPGSRCVRRRRDSPLPNMRDPTPDHPATYIPPPDPGSRTV
jgi:hypothetical protein